MISLEENLKRKALNLRHRNADEEGGSNLFAMKNDFQTKAH
jgi:hypothetical protein